MSEMLIEEANDIFAILSKNQYAPKETRAASWEKAIKEDFPHHFANLEKLLNGPQFCSKVLAGDLAIYAVILTIRASIDPKAASQFPKLNAFYEMINNSDAAKRFAERKFGTYFSLEAK